MLRKLWLDEGGAVITPEITLLGTIIVLAVAVAMHGAADAINTELADTGGAIGNLDQTYTISTSIGHAAAKDGWSFTDAPDFCDGTTPDGNNSRCLDFSVGVLGTDNVNP